MNYGIWTLVPPLAIIVFAVLTKKSFESLIFGSLVAYIIMYGVGFLVPWCSMLLEECSNADNEYILLICGLFGSLVAILREAKGPKGFSRLVGKICKTERSLLLTSTLMGVIIFIDDYLNIMTIGTCMKETCDKLKVPREALAYVIDSTGAPVCALLPFSTWTVFYSGIFYHEQSIADLGYGSSLNTYIHAIPFMFYPIFALLVVALFSAGIIPKFSAMKTAYERSAKVDTLMAEDDGDKEGSLLDFVLPIGVLIGVTIVTGDMLVAVVAALGVCLVMYLIEKRMTFNKYGELFLNGFAEMIPVDAILLSSFVVRGACGKMNLSGYVISLVQPILNAQILPVVLFILIAGLTFITSSFWGIEAIAVPIVVPLAVALNSNLLLVLAAVVSGGVFGSHACFFSDATVLSSATCEIDNLSHAVTQIPYAMISAVLAIIGFVVAGYVMC